MQQHDHETTRLREAREEAQYEVGRSTAVLMLATIDEMRARQETQVGAYAFECNQRRDEMRSLNAAYDRSQARVRSQNIDLTAYGKALDAANSEIARLAKRARVKAAAIPHPVTTNLPATASAEEAAPF
jgi:hypothetical protein